MKSSLTRHIAWFTLALLMTACTPQPTQLPTVEPVEPTVTQTMPSLTPSATVSPTLTPLPTSIPTQVNTATPSTKTPTPIPTPLPLFPSANSSVPLSYSGPWLSYLVGTPYDVGNVIVTNLDGSGRRQISSNALWVISNPVSPYLALLIREPDFHPEFGRANVLEIIHLPDGVKKTIPLISNPEIQVYDYRRDFDIQTKEQAISFISISVSADWSPNGRYLAFTAAIDGPTSDLYVYDTVSDQIRRLTDGTDMATGAEWSLDSLWIVHRGINGWGEGCFETGVWAAAVDGSQIKWLSKGHCFEITQWTGPETFEVSYGSTHGGAQPTGFFYYQERIDIAAGTSTALNPFIPEYDPMNIPIFNCLDQKKVETANQEINSTRIDSPDGYWFVVINNGLRVYSANRSLVAEFDHLVRFDGWQPDSKAIVFTTDGKTVNHGSINYFQPGNRSLKTYEDVIPTDGDNFNSVFWGSRPSSFFLQVGSTQELDYFEPLKNQLLRVDWPIGNWDTPFTWIGIRNFASSSSWMECYLGQP